jgi:hypothetical protein
MRKDVLLRCKSCACVVASVLLSIYAMVLSDLDVKKLVERN